MYPFGDLPSNVAAFCGVLRREHGFRVGPRELQDTVRALAAIDLSIERQVRDALRIVLSRSVDDLRPFDAAFDAFFFPGPAGVPQTELPAWEHPRRAANDAAARGGETTGPGDARSSDEDDESGDSGAGAVATDEEPGDTEELTARIARARYSPLAAEGSSVIDLLPAPADWTDAARVLVHHLQLGLSRRWRSGRRGPRFDLRRTWRASLQTGGEALTPRWLRRVRRSPRFLVLVDGSRSMGPSAVPALRLAVALATVTRRVEAFVFSTMLRRVTAEVKHAAAGERRAIDVAAGVWGGGTRIGASLRECLDRHGERRISRETIVIVASDGLDVGDPAMLRDAMGDLRRRSAAVVWLNPLLETPGYEPTASGMLAARPFITTLASVSRAADVKSLARRVRVR